MLKKYYASLLIAGGAVLLLAAPAHWVLVLAAYGMISGGTMLLGGASRWYGRASIVSDLLLLLTLLGSAPLFGAGLFQIGAQYAAVLAQWVLGCLLFCAYGAVMRAAGRGMVPEWLLLTLWSVGHVLPLLAAVMPLAPGLVEQVGALTRLLSPLGFVALILDTFRAQIELIRLEGENI